MEYFDKTSFSKITLGTVQLSMKYGISSKIKPSIQTTNEVLVAANQLGINSFDTSPQYGDIERVLGDFFKKKSILKPTIISKIPSIQFNERPNFDDVYKEVKRHVEKSLKNLKLEKMPVCLIHDPQNMINYDGMVVKALEQLRVEGHIEKIGCSVYTVNDVQKFLDLKKFQVIEIRVNLFNTKIIADKMFDQLNKNKIIILARSVFLQGLFFLDPHNLPPKVEKAKKYLLELNKISSNFSIPIPQLALSFVNNQKHISSIIIGVENQMQLQQNMECFNFILPKKVENLIIEKFANVPESINNPLNWI